MSKELIERLRAGTGGGKHWMELEGEAADTIERLELEAVAASIRIENDALQLAELRTLLAQELQETHDLAIERDALARELIYIAGISNGQVQRVANAALALKEGVK